MHQQVPNPTGINPIWHQKSSYKQQKEKKDSPTTDSLKNAKQIATKNQIDHKILIKSIIIIDPYFPDGFSSILGLANPADNDNRLFPSPWLQETIEDNTNSAVPTLAPPPFFDDTVESTEYNKDLIEEYNYELPQLLVEHHHVQFLLLILKQLQHERFLGLCLYLTICGPVNNDLHKK